MHAKLQTTYNKFVKILLNEKQREKYGLQPDNQPLALPGLAQDESRAKKKNFDGKELEEMKTPLIDHSKPPHPTSSKAA